MNIIQFVISILLFSILAFGIGFILNMILRTTWLPVVISLGVIVGSLIYKQIVPGIYDVIILAFGVVGSILSGWTIQLLRNKGYRMF
ncbi:YuiB family protein [Brevibacillus sp. SYSU BS000544]|uniref:YuiB family protein n=1 Tax=Brevibacillus sp. SYSU BS000544 TaxID=3416443 RepID=UPI003CE45C30